MPKLHELLAIDGSVKGQAEKVRNELVGTFTGKKDHFREKLVTFQSLKPNADGSIPEALTKTELSLQTTVKEELAWISPHLAKFFDVSFHVAKANTIAKADVILNGKVFLKELPATAILELEKRAQELHTLISNIPTLDPSKGFEKFETRGKDIFKAREVEVENTSKIQEPLVLYPATKEHPAQTQLIVKDIVTGKTRTVEYSGLITPAEKADMLDRVEQLKVALKAARARANNTKVDTNQKIGEPLLLFVFNNVTPESAESAPAETE